MIPRARTRRTLGCLLLAFLVLNPLMAIPSANAREVAHGEDAPSNDPGPTGDPSAARASAAHAGEAPPDPVGSTPVHALERIEGWAFKGREALGRISARFDWPGASPEGMALSTLDGNLRLGEHQYSFRAHLDPAAWQSRGDLPEIVRFTGLATQDSPLAARMGNTYTILLDVVPSQAYVSGFLEIASPAADQSRARLPEEERLAFHLFPDPARAILALPGLLDQYPAKAHALLPTRPSTNDATRSVSPAKVAHGPADAESIAPVPDRNGTFDSTPPRAKVAAAAVPAPAWHEAVPWSEVPESVRDTTPLPGGVGVPYVIVDVQQVLDDVESATGLDVSIVESPPHVGLPSTSGGAAEDNGAPGFQTTRPEQQTGDPGSGGSANEPPGTPGQPAGLVRVPVGLLARYEAHAIDPELKDVRLTFDWGDDSAHTTTAFVKSGTPASADHAWSQPGTYTVRARAEDTRGAMSAWGPALRVEVLAVETGEVPDAFRHLPEPVTQPLQPAPPHASETRLVIGETAKFTFSTLEVTQTGVSYEIDWDENRERTRTEWFPSGEEVHLWHAWSQPGEKRVVVRAYNTQGAASTWSEPTLVTVKAPGGSAPTSLTISGDTVTRATGRYLVRATDPDHKPEAPAVLRYTVEWGDGTRDVTPWVESGTTVSFEHTWNAPRTYTVQVSARDDRGQVGGPSALGVSVQGNPPLVPQRPKGWDLLPQGSEGRYATTTTDADGDAVRYEFDWGDGTTSITNALFPPGAEGYTGKAWTKAGTYAVTVRAIDAYGMKSAWSQPLNVTVGESHQPFEFVLSDVSVSTPTPHVGDNFQVTAWVENRAAGAVSVDVTVYEDDVPVCSLPFLLDHAKRQEVRCTHEFPGALGTGVRQIRVQADASNTYPEISKTNNVALIDVKVRNPAVGDRAFGALYDGPGPVNVAGYQLNSGLYQRYRTPDENTFDELDVTGTRREARLLLWSQHLNNTETTWHFTDSATVTVRANDPLRLTGPRPNMGDLDALLKSELPVLIGYVGRANPPIDSTVAMNYTVGNATRLLQTTPQILQWDLRTHRVPYDKEHAIGVQFDLTTSSQAGWRHLDYDVRLEYTRAERQGNNSVFLFHEVLRAGTSPIRASVEAGDFPDDWPYARGGDFNLGDRSMTSQPVWDADADVRRTYFDGATDKSPKQEGDATDTESFGTNSAAYFWFRLDGPIYKAHDVQWRWYGPRNGYAEPIATSEVLHLESSEDAGFGPNSFYAWAQFRSGLRFPDPVPVPDRGTWYCEVLVDGTPVALGTLHILATTSDPSDGPHQITDEEFNARVSEQEEAIARMDPSNENLPFLHPVNWDYLNRSHVDQTLRPAGSRADDLTSVLINRYVADQVNEALNITRSLARDLPPGVAVPHQVERIREKAESEVVTRLREFPQPSRVLRTVQDTVWDTLYRALGACELPLPKDWDVEQSLARTGSSLDCLTQSVLRSLNATRLVDEVVETVMTTIGSTLENATMLVDAASGLVDQSLEDVFAIIEGEPVQAPPSSHTSFPLPELPLPVPTHVHPTHLADVLPALYEAVMQTNLPIAQAETQEAKNDTVATLDSLWYNLYVTDGARVNITRNIALLDEVTIDVDNNTATGASGKELRVRATLTNDGDSLVDGWTLDPARATPTLHIEKLDPNWASPALVCAFFQLPAAPYVAAMCIDTRAETLDAQGVTTRGLPRELKATMTGFGLDDGELLPHHWVTGRAKSDDLNVSASLTASGSGDQPALVLGSFFEVDMTKATKPRLREGNRANGSLLLTRTAGTSGFTLRKTFSETGAPTTQWTWRSETPGTLQAGYDFARGERKLTAASRVASAPVKLEITSSRPDASDTRLDVTATSIGGRAAGLDLVIHDDVPDAPTERFHLTADALPASLTLRANDRANAYTFTASDEALSNVSMRVAHGRTSCPSPLQMNALVREDGCTALNAHTLRTLNVDLASGGPGLALTASATGQTLPFASTIRSSEDRSLDATLSDTPTRATLRSALSDAGGHTTLTWEASKRIAAVSLLAHAGGTIVNLTATNEVPVDLQAAYAWNLDAVRIETQDAQGAGRVKFLLTNTGEDPGRPDGDYIVGKRADGRVAAAASLTRLTRVETALANSNFLVSADATLQAPFAVRYARDEGSAFVLDAPLLPTGGRFRLEYQNPASMTHRLTYEAGAGGAHASWAGRFPPAISGTPSVQVEGRIEDAPTRLVLTAAPRAQRVEFDSTERVGRVSVLHAPAGRSVSTLAGSDVIHLGVPVSGVDVYRVDLGGVSAFSAAKATGAIHAGSTPEVGRPVRIQLDESSSAGPSFTYLETGTLPTSLDVTFGRAGFTHEASTAVPTLLLRARDAGNVLNVTAEQLPTQASVNWIASGSVVRATSTHNGERVKRFEIEGNFPPVAASNGPGETVRLHLASAPPHVDVVFNSAQDEVALTASPSKAGLVLFQHATGTSNIQLPGEPQYAFLTRAQDSSGEAVSTQAIRLENVTALTLRVRAAAGLDNELRIEAVSPNRFYAQYATEDEPAASMTAVLSNIPGSVSLRYALGTGNDGMGSLRLSQEGAGVLSRLQLQATQAGYVLDLDARDTPRLWSTSWTPGQPLELSTQGGAVTLDALGFMPEGEHVPTLGRDLGDYVLVDESEAHASRIGIRFTGGIIAATVDGTEQSLHVDQPRSGRSLSMLHKRQEATATLDLTGAPARFALRTTPQASNETARGVTWDASGATSTLAYGLDAPAARWRWNATGLPSRVNTTFNPPEGTLDADVAGGAGTFDLKYATATEPGQPARFHGDGAGLFVLARPTGPEGYPTQAETFTLNLSGITSASARFSGSTGQGAGAPFVVSVKRASGNAPTPIAIVLATGAEAFRLDAGSLQTRVEAAWEVTDADSLQGLLDSDASLQDVGIAYRGEKGIATLEAPTMPTRIEVRLDASEESLTATGSERIKLTYDASTTAPLIRAHLNARGGTANLTLENAPKGFRVDAPTQCADDNDAAHGRAWVPNGGSAGRATLLLTAGAVGKVPDIASPVRVVAGCDGESASAQLDVPGFMEASWRSEPALGESELVVRAAAATLAATRAVLTSHGRAVILDATADKLPAYLLVLVENRENYTSAKWKASERVGNARLQFIPPGGGLNARVTDAPTEWSVTGSPIEEETLIYEADEPAGALALDLSMPSMGAEVRATQIPTTISWGLPFAQCSSALPLNGRVWTRETGYVGSLEYWMVTGKAGHVVHEPGIEYAALQCDEERFKSGAFLTGLGEVAWSRTIESIALEEASTSALGLGAALKDAAQSSQQAPLGPTDLTLGLQGVLASSAPPLIAQAESPGPMGPQTTEAPRPLAETGTRSTTKMSNLRDPSSPPPQTMKQGYYDRSNADESTTTRVENPGAETIVEVTTGTDAYSQHEHDVAPGARVDTVHESALGIAEWHVENAPRVATVRTTGSGFEHEANGPADAVHALVALAGSQVSIDLQGEVPEGVSFQMSTHACTGDEGPFTVHLSSTGGHAGRLRAHWMDAGTRPKLEGPGLAFRCDDDLSRSMSMDLPAVTQHDLGYDPCGLQATMAAPKGESMYYEVDTPYFRANFTPKSDLDHALVHLQLQAGGIGLQPRKATQPDTSLILTSFGAGYERREIAGTSADGVGCAKIQLGGEDVQAVKANLAEINGDLTMRISTGIGNLKVIDVQGGSLDAAELNLALVQQTEEQMKSPVSISAKAALEIGTLDVSIQEEQREFQSPIEDRSIDSLYMRSSRDGRATIAHLLGVRDAFFLMNHDPVEGTLEGTVSYAEAARKPLEVQWFEGWDSTGRLFVDAIPRSLAMSLRASCGDIEVTATKLSDPIGRIDADSRNECVDAEGKVEVTHKRSTITGIPAGEYSHGVDELKPLELAFKTGKAGRVVAESKGGAIGSVHASLVNTKDPSRVLSFSFTNVRVRAEWDLDGETDSDRDIKDSPYFFFLKTSLPLTGLSVTATWGDWGLEWRATGGFVAAASLYATRKEFVLPGPVILMDSPSNGMLRGSIPVGYVAGGFCFVALPSLIVSYKGVNFPVPLIPKGGCVGVAIAW